MRRLLLISAILFVAVPASADEELYMVCRVRARNTRTAVTSGKIITDEVAVDTVMFKFDMTNKTFRNHQNPTMTDFIAKGDKLIQNDKITKEEFKAHLQGRFPFNPPGPFEINNWWRNKNEHQVIKGKGDCRPTTREKWEEILEMVEKEKTLDSNE